MSVTYVEQEHPRGPHGEWVKKYLPNIKNKTPPKSFKFYKQGYKPKSTGPNAQHYGKKLYAAKKAGHFSSDYELWLAAQKLHAEAKKKHPSNAPTPHGIVNAAFSHEIADTGDLKMLGDTGLPPAPTKNVHDVTPGGIKTVSKFLAPGQLEPTGKKMPGVNGALVYKDAKGNQWLVKFPGGSKGTSKAYSNSQFLVDLDVATSRIQNKAGLPVPSIHAKVVDGKLASVHKMYSRAKDTFPGGKIEQHDLNDEKLLELQKNMVFDWLLSNHDPHSGNFLETDKGIIGIDKGQSFKYFGKDKLTPQFGSDINPPLYPNVPVYSRLMEMHVKGEINLFDPKDSHELNTTIKRIQDIPDNEYKDILRPYAEKAADVGLLSYPGKNSTHTKTIAVSLFLQAAVARKNNLATDFENLFSELDSKKFTKPPATQTPSAANQITLYNKDLLSFNKLKDFVSKNPPDEGNWPATIYDWYGQGKITWSQHQELKKIAFGEGQQEAPKPDVPAGYNIVQHPTETGKFTIQKPTGDFAKNKDGVVKAWDTAEAAANSSTMAKYKGQVEQQAKAGIAGAQAFAASAPDIKPGDELNLTQSAKYNNLKSKIAAGEDFTPDEYVELKSYVQQIKSQMKSAGAAQDEGEFEPSGFETPTKATKKTKGGFKEKPKFKMHGGAPPELDKAKGPNALELGKKLWEMKKSGKIADDYQMWNEAAKLATADKKQAMAKDPNAVLGEHYSSKNAIRNVAMRLEFDETGDVTWETTEEKTSETIGQTIGQVKKTSELHAHKPVVKASASHSIPTQANSKFPEHWDVNAVVGSYTNPHSFKQGDTQAIQAYGYKYTDHSKPWPQAQKSAWYNFSGSGSGSVNTFFRTGDVGLFGDVEDIKKRAKALVDAFKSDNVKPLEDWTIVTRGTNGGWEFGIGSDTVSFEQLQAEVGKVKRNKCPVSTSLRGRPAFGGAHRVTYKLPPGFRGLGIYGKSAHPGENEMILPPGMAYRILDVKKGTENYPNEILVEVVDVKLPEIT